MRFRIPIAVAGALVVMMTALVGGTAASAAAAGDNARRATETSARSEDRSREEGRRNRLGQAGRGCRGTSGESVRREADLGAVVVAYV